MSATVFDVVCFGGPLDGQRKTLPEGRKGWEHWRTTLEHKLEWREEHEPGPDPPQYGQEYVGSYVVETHRGKERTGRAVWIQAVGR